MATVSRGLPRQPHLDVPKREARALLNECRAGSREALDRIRRRHPKYRAADHPALASARLLLSDAQLVIAREYGFSTWTQLKQRITANTVARLLDQAIRSNDRETVVRILRAQPELLHIPLVSGNWGPPMSHAANLGRVEMIEVIAELGARDFQHAFDRAVLQGKLDCARWLREHGAALEPGIVMGPCETLNPGGLGFLDQLGAPFTDAKGDPLAPLALVLTTYSRNPAGKRECLQIFAQRGYGMPDTPIMALHRGDAARLGEFLRRDPRLAHQRFRAAEIYPSALGCAEDLQTGMCGTPVDGTTLLHMAVDFDEQEIFDLLLASGADVNARALVDQDGFGGQTPLFNALVSCAYICGRQRDARMVRELLSRGASTALQASVRKFLDWREQPGWHEARNVTAVEWARGFPERSWVNQEGLSLIG